MTCHDIHHSYDFKIYEKIKAECTKPDGLCNGCLEKLAEYRQRKQARKPGEVTDEMVEVAYTEFRKITSYNPKERMRRAMQAALRLVEC